MLQEFTFAKALTWRWPQTGAFKIDLFALEETTPTNENAQVNSRKILKAGTHGFIKPGSGESNQISIFFGTPDSW